VIVDCALYIDGTRQPGPLPLEEALQARHEPNSFVWIGVHEPDADEFDRVREAYNLHPLAVEDALRGHQRPKIELYEDCMFVVVRTARYVDSTESVEFAEIQVIIGDGFVVSVRHGQASALAETRAKLETRPEMLRCGPGSVLHGIIDHVVDDYKPVIAGLDNDILEIESTVFAERRRGVDPTRRVYLLRQEVLDFYRATKPLLEAIGRLALGRLPHCSEDLAEYFRDVQDHLRKVVDDIEDFRDQLGDILNANLTQVGIRQNDDMRTMSAWLAIGAFPTVVGAIYGMNFESMPELSSPVGYPLVMLFTGLVCFLLYRRFKRAGWL
jgi:magnesium transporter